jgi:hypothetical protein
MFIGVSRPWPETPLLWDVTLTEYWKGAFVFLLAALACSGQVSAEQVNPPLGPNWCSQAELNLTRTNGRPFDCEARNLRCVKMNNYGCLQQPARTPFNGTNWGPYRRGARDHANHAIFSDPAMSIVTIMNVYRRYLARGWRSAEVIAEHYSPWCDTLGSVRSRTDGAGRVWYRTCGRTSVPPGALACTKPANGQPAQRQCEACNCPNEVARRMLDGVVGISPSDDLVLFDAAGAPNDLLVTIIANKMRQELGYRPSSDFLARARGQYRIQEW